MDNSSDSNAIILGGESLRDAETKMVYWGLVNGSSHRSKRVGGAAVPETVVLFAAVRRRIVDQQHVFLFGKTSVSMTA